MDDQTAPARVGSNAASGVAHRLQVGQRYFDREGHLYPRGVHNPDSSNYDPAAANATHIAWPPGRTTPLELAMVDPALLDAILAGASTPSPEQDLWLDSFTDQLGAYSDEQAALVACTLTRLVLAGLTLRARESALHAVAAVVEWHPAARPAAKALCTVDRTALTASELEYLDFLCA